MKRFFIRLPILLLTAGSLLPGAAPAQDANSLSNPPLVIVNGQSVTRLVVGQPFKIRLSSTGLPARRGFSVYRGTLSTGGFFQHLLYEELPAGDTLPTDYPLAASQRSTDHLPAGKDFVRYNTPGTFYMIRCLQDGGRFERQILQGSCLGNTRAVTFEMDAQPIAGAAPSAQSWLTGVAVDLTLPAATGGNISLAYSLSPALPAGLRFDPATRRITGTPATVSAPTTYTMTATDFDGDTATLQFEARVQRERLFRAGVDKPNVFEGDTVLFSVGLHPDGSPPAAGMPVTVAWTLSGTSGADANDYTSAAGNTGVLTFTAANWDTDQTVSVVTVDDIASEGPETLTLTLSNPTAADSVPTRIDTERAAASVTIAASEPVANNLLSNPPLVIVNGQSVDRLVAGQPFKIRLSSAGLPSPQGFSVYWGVAPAGVTVTFVLYEELPAGDTLSRDYPLAANQRSADHLPENQDFVTLNAVGTFYFVRCLQAGGRFVDNTVDSTCRLNNRGTVFEEDTEPTAGAAPSAQAWTVGAAVDLTLPAATGGNISLAYSLSPALPAGLRFDPATRRITGTPATLSVPTTYTMTATDFNGDTADLQFEARVQGERLFRAGVDDPNTIEGDTVLFSVGLHPNSDPPVSAMPVTVTWTLSGMSGADANDYTSAAGNTGVLTFTAANWDTDQTVSVTIVDDTSNEGPETLTLSLSNPTAGDSIPTRIDTERANAGVTIAANDPVLRTILSTPLVIVNGQSVNRLVAGQPFKIRLSSTGLPARQGFSVYLASSLGGGFSQPHILYEELPAGDTLPTDYPLAASQRSAEHLPEGKDFVRYNTPGTFYLRRCLQSGGRFMEQIVSDSCLSHAHSTTFEADSLPSLSDAPAPSAQTWLTGATVDLALPPATRGNISLAYSLSPALPAGLSFNPKTRAITGRPTALSAPTTYTMTVTDFDGDTAALQFEAQVQGERVFSAGVDDPNAFEGDTVLFSVGLRPGGSPPAAGMPVTVAWTLSGVDADDYTSAAGNTGILTFTAANWDTDQTVSVTIVDDTSNEGPETLTLSLSNPTAADSVPTNINRERASASVTIAGSDPVANNLLSNPPLVIVNGQSVDRLVAGQPFKIRLSSAGLPSPQGFSVYWGIAPAGVTVTFLLYEELPAGDTLSRDYPLAANQRSADHLPEDRDFVTLNEVGTFYFIRCLQSRGRFLKNAVFSTCGLNIQGTVFEEDTEPTAGAAPSAQAWTVGAAVDLTLPAATGGNISLAYSLSPALPAGLSFDPATRQISGTPTTVSVLTTYTMTATDFNGDTAALQFEARVQGERIFSAGVDDPNAFEGDTVLFSVGLHPGSDPPVSGMPVTVTWTLSGVDANDYTSAAGNTGILTFTAANWETDQTVSVTIVDDTSNEGPETLTLSLSNPTAADSVPTNINRERASASVTIAGSDPVADNLLSNPPLVIVNGQSVDRLVAGQPFKIRLSSAGLPSPQGFSVYRGRNPAGVSLAFLLYEELPVGDTLSRDYPLAANQRSAEHLPENKDFVTQHEVGTFYFIRCLQSRGRFLDNIVLSTCRRNYQGTVFERDTQPTAGAAPSAQAWTTGAAVDLTLPAAIGGNISLTYSLSPALPTGLSFDPATRQISGTPTTVSVLTTYTMTATDFNGDTAALQFEARVQRERLFRAGVDNPSVFEGDSVLFLVGLHIGADSDPPATGMPVTVAWTLSGTDADDYISAAGNSGVLTFTAANWDTDQTVSVMIVDDSTNEGAETLTLSLSNPAAADSFPTGIDTERASAGVTIAGSDPVANNLLSNPPLVIVNGQSVDRLVAGQPFKIRLSSIGLPSPQGFTVYRRRSPAGVSFSPVLYEELPAGGTLLRDYPLAANQRSADHWPAGQDFVTQDEAGTFYFIRCLQDGGQFAENAVNSTCLDNTQGTIFETDIQPTAGDPPSAQTWTTGFAVDLTLPAATGGNILLTYSLSPALPTGLSFNPATRQISGTPTETSSPTTYTMTATDFDGDTVALQFEAQVQGQRLFRAGVDKPNVFEGDTVLFSVGLHPDGSPPAAGMPVTVAWTLSGTSGADANDYTSAAGNTGILTFTAANWDTDQTVSVVTIDDIASEGPETLTLTLSNPTAADSVPTNINRERASASVTIAASEPVANNLLSNPPLVIVNGQSVDRLVAGQPFKIRLSSAGLPSPQGFSVYWGVAPAGVTVTFLLYEELPAGDTLSRDYPLAANQRSADHLPENKDFVTLNAVGTFYFVRCLQAGGRFVDNTVDSTCRLNTQGTVFEEDTEPTAGAAPSAQAWLTGATVDLTLPAATGGNISLAYSLSPALPAGLSFDPATRQISGTPTTVSVLTTYTMTATDFNGDTAALQFEARVQGERLFRTGVDDPNTIEGDTVLFSVGLDPDGSPPAAAMPVTVAWTLSGADANDYTSAAGNTGVLTFTAANWETDQTVSVTIVDDTSNEGPETLTLTLSNPTAADSVPTRIDTERAGVTIAASDPITATLSRRSGDSGRLLSGDDARYVLMLSAAAPAALTFTVNANVGGTRAAAPSVTVAMGERQADVTIAAANINTAREAEGGAGMLTAEITAVAGQPTGAEVTLGAAHPIPVAGWELTIDQPGSSPSDRISITEGDNFVLTVSLRGAPPPGALMVPWSVAGSGGSAADADDFDFPGGVLPSGMLDLSGMSGGAITVTSVDGRGNPMDDLLDEHFVLNLGALSGAQAGGAVIATGSSEAHVTIETPPKHAVLTDVNTQAREGRRVAISVTVTGHRTRDSSRLHYTLTGSATPGADYEVVTASGVAPYPITATCDTAMCGGQLTLPGDAFGARFDINILSDAALDAAETIVVTMTDHTGGGGGSRLTLNSAVTTTVTIADGDLAGVTIAPVMLTVGEGASGHYTVVLDAVPGGDVMVTPGSDNDDVMVGAALTFTTMNWNTEQTVTINAEADDDADNDSATVSHLVSGYGDVTTAGDVRVTVTDDDTPGVTIDPVTLTVGEGARGHYTVVLDTIPDGDVMVTPGSDNDDVTVGVALTFTTMNWNTAQTVTVNAATDDDADNDSATISHAVSGYGDVTTGDDVMVTVTDDDTSGVTIDPVTLTVGEGARGHYTVVLDAVPDGDVMVTPGSDNDDVTVGAALTFTTMNWNTEQTVTVNAETDDDADNDSATISHAVSGYGDVTASDVRVMVTDDDTAGVTVDPVTLTVGEGASGHYTVVLDTIPDGDVMVTPGSDNDDVMVGVALTFTTMNWNTEQTVTVNAETDDDADNDSATVSHAVSGYGDVTTADDVRVMVTDDDTPGVTVDPVTLTVGEGVSEMYSVVLTSAPASMATITPSSSDEDVATVSDALTFTTMNWNTEQTVTVNAEMDDDADNDSATISHAVSGYGDVTASDVRVMVTDDDMPGVTIDPVTLTVGEGASGHYTVVLDTIPDGDVMVTPGSDNDDVMVGAALTFTTMNWNMEQTVTINAEADDDTDNDSATISHVVSGYGDVTTADDVMVTVTDDDTPGVTVDPVTLTVGEGASGHYTVVLDTIPDGDVMVTPGSDNDDVTVGVALTFTTLNWNTAQTVTVNAEMDDDADNDSATVSHAVSGYGDVTTADDVMVTVTDGDTPGVTIDPVTLTVGEGASGHYTVVLDAVPGGDVMVTPGSDNDDVMVGAALTFTTMNWNTAQTVTINAEADDDTDNDSATISHAVSGYGDVTTGDDVMVTVTDDDTPGVTIDPVTLTVGEGASGHYTVVLDTIPEGDVMVTPGSDNDDVMVGAALTFTTMNWNTAQTVTVNAEMDDDTDNDSATVSHAVSGYGDVTAADDVMVTVTDDDTPGVTIDPVTLTVGEGASGHYTVVLDTIPDGDVMVTPGSDNDDVTVGAALTFTTMNWNTAQTVTVNAEMDDDADNDSATISHAVSGYGDVTAGDDVMVTVTDNNMPGVTIDPVTLTVGEGASGHYTVVLDTIPGGDVMVTPGSDNDDVMVGAALTFTTMNWNTAQTVTVNAETDDDADADSATISHAVSGYGDVTAADDVMVTVTDDDTPGVTVDPVTLTVGEGARGHYTVVLDTLPGGDVMVTPGSDNDDVTVGVALTFTTMNWNTAQTVTVNAEMDDDATDDNATISHLVSGYGDVTAGDVMVTVTDDDTPGVTVDPITLTVGEGVSEMYSVVLTSAPASMATITPSSSDEDVATVSDALTFTTMNWNTEQTVTVNAEMDDDADNDSATVSHLVSGYGDVTAGDDVMVTVTDDDTPGVTIDPVTLTVGEGVSEMYSVVLTSAPASMATITPSSSDEDVATVSNALTFTTMNWNTAQTVTVNAEMDDDATNDSATISHAVSGYGDVTASDVRVMVTDDDTAGVTVDPVTLTVGEGVSEMYSVVLTSAPASMATITPSSSDEGVATVSDALTFTTMNWNTAQTVTVNAEMDDDADNDSATISHAVSGYGDVTASDVMVRVTDDDTAGVTVDPITLTVGEGASGHYTVVLDAVPDGDVMVTPGSDNDDVTVGAALTFTTMNWNTAQTVTVNAEMDDDADNDSATISHAVSGYGDVTTGDDVMVTVTDDDTPGVTIDPVTLTVGEGARGHYTVVLDTIPDGDVMVTPGSDNDDVMVGAALTFTTMNWNTAQTVTVNAEMDDDADNDSATISHAVSGYGDVTASDVRVMVTDDDTPGVTVDPITLTVGEGARGHYTVVLDTIPDGDVMVTPGSDNDDVTVGVALTFTTMNWNTAQTVTVNAEMDDDADNDSATISHVVSGYGDVTTGDDVRVTVTDDDTPGVMIDPVTLTVGEGVSEMYSVVLTSAPASMATITPSSSDEDVATVSNALTFTTMNWNTEQTVTVNAEMDDDATNDNATISHVVSGYGDVTASDVRVMVTDDDTAGVTVDPITLTVGEGVSEMYSVVLTSAPASMATITPSSSDEDVATVSNALTFTTMNWNTAQTVTVNAEMDDDADNDNATISHAVSGYGDVTASDVRVTVTDDDTPGVTVDPVTLTVGEGASGHYTVVLDTIPDGDVMVTPGSDNDDVTVGAALTFTTMNWNTEQTVTVNAETDDDTDNDNATISHAVSGYGDVTAADDVRVTVTDDDTPGVTIDPVTLTVGEGARGHYTVVLDTIPDGDVMVTPGSDNDDVMVGAALTFTTMNWNTEQTVTVNAEMDDDATNDSATISHLVSGYGDVTASDVRVMVTDDDTAGVTVDPITLTVGEGAHGHYTVVLDTIPDGDVMVTPGSDNDDVMVGAALTFTTLNWNTAQTVTVNAETDDDATDDNATISHAVSGYGDVTTGDDVRVTVTDDDTPGVTVDPVTLTVGEGVSEMYSVVLTSAPASMATITPSSSDEDVATVSDALTFTTMNWNTAQTVTINAETDDDADNDSATVSHLVSGYGDVTAASDVRVMVTDDDTAGVTVTPTTVGIIEQDTGGIYSLVLDTQPGGDVMITPSVTPPGHDLTLTPAAGTALIFTATNWNSAQVVTVAAGNDHDGDNDTATISHAVAAATGDAYHDITAEPVTVMVSDNDTPGVVVSRTSIAMTEAESVPYSVRLATRPSGDVTITPSSDNTEVTLTPAALTFTGGNWNTARTVIVSANHDPDGTADRATINHAVSGANYGGVTAADVAVEVTDDDTPGVTIDPVTTLTVGEGGRGHYTVVLDTLPGGDVMVTPGSDNDDVTVGVALTFTTMNWNTAQTVTVNAEMDADATDDSATISHAVSGYGDVTAGDVRVMVTDDDTAGVTVTPTTVGIIEQDTGGTYSLVLDTQPGGDVMITPSVTPPGHDLTLTPAAGTALIFTTTNWNSAQVVTVAAGNDHDGDDDTATISHAVAAAATGDAYHDVTAEPVTVMVSDNDTPGVVVSRTSIAMTEAESAPYSVRLATRPSGDVTITPSSDNTEVTFTPAALTFTGGNWNTARTVTVTANHDPDGTADRATINHAVSGANYGGVTAADVAVVVTDDDTPGVTIDPRRLTVTEQATTNAGGAYTVALDIPPSANVTITPSSDNTEVTFTPAALTFTGGNWNTARTVTVSAAADSDSAGDSATLSHTAAGASEYAALSLDTVEVRVDDDDRPRLLISAVTLTVGEQSEATYQVRLNTLPAAAVTVTPSSDNTAVAVAPAALTFTAANWNTAQALSVNAADDPDGANDSATISHTAGGANYAALAAQDRPDVAVTVIDNDTIGVTVSPDVLGVTGQSASGIYTLALGTRPSGNVIITPSSADTAIATVAPMMLTFTAANWNTAQTVTVTVADDAAAGTRITHRVSAAGTDYDGVTIADVRIRPASSVDMAALDALSRAVVPEVSRAIAAQQTGAIAWRMLEAGGGDGGGAGRLNLGGQGMLSTLAARYAQTPASNDFDIKKILGDMDFVAPMAGVAPDGNAATANLWGAGDYRRIGGESGNSNTEWGGSLFAAHLGFDARLGPDLLAGLMVSYSETDITYKYPNAAGGEQKGDYELDMTSINPYLGWSALDGRLDMRAAIGYGNGDLEITPDGGGAPDTGDVTMQSIAVGGGGLIRNNGNTGHELRINAEVFHSRTDLGGVKRAEAQNSNASELPELKIDATLLRLMLESRRPHTLANGARITPNVEIGMRGDTGDGQTGTGIEVGGGVHYQDTARGLTLQANARTLLIHDSDSAYDDWGLRGKVQLQPGADGQGLSLSLTPGYGNTTAGATAIWNKGLPTATATDLQARLDTRIGYGLNLEPGLLTPYTEMTLRKSGQTYRLGVQWDMAKTFDLKLVTEQRDDHKETSRRVLLKGEMSF